MTSQTFPPPPFKDMYSWNYFLTRELEDITSKSLSSYYWVMPIVHGAFIQRKLSDYGRSLNLTLLARRSRHFAGTRYLKRGVSDRGKVANDVEHEQILHDETSSPATFGTFSSFLQVRGSIPTYWTQESSATIPKPPIVLNRVDPTYQATKVHFEDLIKRYGSPIIVADLVKQSEKREREVIVGNEFRHAIDYLNCHIEKKHKIRYCAFDYSHMSKHQTLNVSPALQDLATWAVNQTGFFCSVPRWKIVKDRVEPYDDNNSCGAAFLTHNFGVPAFPMEQKGVLRTNCIDCLDRTNVAQIKTGVEALKQMLVVMGIRSCAKLAASSNIVELLIDMYVEIGDSIAMQYGGSEAHKKAQPSGSATTIPGPMGKHKDLLTAVRRYYSNSFTDRLKQDAMNLFLGHYIPSRHTVPLWEMETDYYLHNFHVKGGRGSMHSMKYFQRYFSVDWYDDDDKKHDKNEKEFNKKASIVEEIGSNTSLNILCPNNDLLIRRVKKVCKMQNEALTVWWRVAIQSYIQQRMWMHLGRSPSESYFPERFESIYQPGVLSQFDEMLTRSWATPKRPSRSAQQSALADEDSDTLLVRKNISPRINSCGEAGIRIWKDAESYEVREDEEGKDNEENIISINGFVKKHGFTSQRKPTFSRFLKSHDTYLSKKRQTTCSSFICQKDNVNVNPTGKYGEIENITTFIFANNYYHLFNIIYTMLVALC